MAGSRPRDWLRVYHGGIYGTVNDSATSSGWQAHVSRSVLMKLLRVETRDGLGPYRQERFEYRAGPGYIAAGDANNNIDSHPTPQNDKVLRDWWSRCSNTSRYSCGFESMKQLLEWFPKEKWHCFQEYNDTCDDVSQKFGIYEYEIDHLSVHLGDKQCVFLKDESYDRKLVSNFGVELWEIQEKSKVSLKAV